VARSKYTAAARVMFRSEQVNRPRLETIKKLLFRFHGPCPVSLTIHYAGRGEVDLSLPEQVTIRPCAELTEAINTALGYQAVSYSTKPIERPERKKGGWDRAKALPGSFMPAGSVMRRE
jgi:DNA polymerase-3 subunit alpha